MEQQKHEIKRLSEEFRVRSSRKQNLNTGNIDPMVQMEALMEEKQSLFNYIQELRKEYNEKNVQHKQMFEELERCQQKQQMFVSVERPKLIRQISERTGQIKKLQSEIEQLRMENNLIQLKLENQIEEFKNTKKQDERKKEQSIGIMTTEIRCRPTSTQTQLEDFELQTLKAELKLLKSERDYYMQEFKKKAAESSENYLLKLQLKAYQVQNN